MKTRNVKLVLNALVEAIRHHKVTSMPLAIREYGSLAAAATAGTLVWNTLVPDAILLLNKELKEEMPYPVRKERKWFSGPPPFIGWWNASNSRSHSDWRWWNGSDWSAVAYDTNDSKEAGIYAAVTRNGAVEYYPIEWTKYWPKNAIVKRVNPNDRR